MYSKFDENWTPFGLVHIYSFMAKAAKSIVHIAQVVPQLACMDQWKF
jgi:hypothetical protein